MQIATAEDAAALLRPFLARTEGENVAVLHLANDRVVAGVTCEAIGGPAGVELPIGAILQSALRLGAKAIVVAHNHPSGNPWPSEADKEATRRLADAARPLGLRLVDHLIFAGGAVQSLAALGLL